MKPTILILVALLIIIGNVIAQTKKRQKSTTDIDFETVKEDACGIKQSLGERLEQIKLEWRSVGPSNDASFYYNTYKLDCDSKTKTVKVWIKEIRERSKTKASMTKYELNCRTEQFRILSMVEYYENGNIGETYQPANPKWADVVPETIGNAILITVCRKPV
nr:hypothetical protein [uncultured bacterium]